MSKAIAEEVTQLRSLLVCTAFGILAGPTVQEWIGNGAGWVAFLIVLAAICLWDIISIGSKWTKGQSA